MTTKMDGYLRQSWESISSSVTDAWRSASSTKRSFTNKMAYYSGGGLVNLPHIPCPIKAENSIILALSGYRFVHTVGNKVLVGQDTKSIPWGSVGLTAILGVLHVEHSLHASTSAFHTSMNAYRVLELREIYRLITSQVYHSSTTGFLNNVTDLCESASAIESVYGWQGMTSSICFTSLLGQALYIGSTYLAKCFYPASELAREFYRFSTGLSITAVGVRTLSGYLMDGVEMHPLKGSTVVWTHRYQWSMQLLLTGAMLKISSTAENSSTISPYASLDLPSVYACASGVVAGVMASYIFDGPWHSPTLSLCLTDIALQSILLGLSMLSLRSI